MKRHQIIALALVPLAATLVASPTAAQDRGRNTAERAQDRRELEQDHRALRDDRSDLERLDGLVAAWRVAVKAGDAEGAAALYGRIAGEIQRDLGESRRRLGLDRRELGRSGAELRSDRRELRRDRRQLERAEATGDIVSVGLARHELRDDRRDRRDDRRDWQDDRDDLDAARDRLELKQDIARELSELQQAVGDGMAPDARVGARQLELLDAYRNLLRDDLDDDRDEIVEDRRELREDRRETREDRRQRR
jgi:hypothetical protein